MSRILPCRCESPFQDAQYGRGQRVFNPRRGGGWRCTVCGETRSEIEA